MGARLTQVHPSVLPGEDLARFIGTEPENVAWFVFGRTALSDFPLEQEVAVPIVVSELIDAGIEVNEEESLCIRAVVNLKAKNIGDVQPQRITKINAIERDFEYLQRERLKYRGE